jgi:two-component system nitrate/nitrite response regulator NarL
MTDEPTPIRIIVADDHPNCRQDLRRSLESEPGLNILGEASDAHGAVEMARRTKSDILLIDFALSQRVELKALIESGSQQPPVRIVVTLAAIEKVHLVEAFRLGARGVVLKGSTPQVLHKSIRSVMAGQYCLENESVGVLVEALRESLAHVTGTRSPKDYGLTRREVDIITKIAGGRSNREVGEEFAISERTVKHHLTNIFSKVGVTSRLQLALFAVNQQLMSSPATSMTLHPVHLDDDV